MAQSDRALDQLRLPDNTLAASAGPTDPIESRSERRKSNDHTLPAGTKAQRERREIHGFKRATALLKRQLTKNRRV
jgi:hypothetical protein